MTTAARPTTSPHRPKTAAARSPRPAAPRRARRSGELSALDFFCGAGGSTIGASQAGIDVRLGVNHWKRAVETHQLNGTAGYEGDIASLDPRTLLRSDPDGKGPLLSSRILLASPECTNFTQAKNNGGHASKLPPQMAAAMAERSRAGMFEVPRFAEAAIGLGHGFDVIVVENVVDVADWVMIDAWKQALRSLGYDLTFLSLNSAVFGVPQSRDRLYTVAVRKGVPKPDLTFTPQAWCGACDQVVQSVQTFKAGRTVGKLGPQYTYRCPRCAATVAPATISAASVIDFTLPAPTVGERSKPLSAQTMQRIRHGLDRWADPDSGTGSSLLLDAADPAGPPRFATHPRNLAMFASLRARHRALYGPPVTDHQDTSRPVQLDSPGLFVKAFSKDRGHALTRPLGAVTTHDHHWLVQLPGRAGPGTYREPGAISIDDCRYRQLQPSELFRAMGFPLGYQLAGNKAEQTTLLGNAVTPPVMRALCERVVEALTS